jgi:hypothetical protein
MRVRGCGSVVQLWKKAIAEVSFQTLLLKIPDSFFLIQFITQLGEKIPNWGALCYLKQGFLYNMTFWQRPPMIINTKIQKNLPRPEAKVRAIDFLFTFSPCIH